jgi:Predicted phosphatase homologous to the C-terminal domain of histone macroH2A1
MPLRFFRGDITKLHVDAIVNAANRSLLGGGGVDGAIHAAAGSGLTEECRALGGCRVGEAKITRGYNLPALNVIHAVGPVWRGGNEGEEELLESAFLNSLKLAKAKGLETIAFPLISAGVFGYPKDKVVKIAVRAFGEFLKDNEMDITLVFFGGDNIELGGKRRNLIKKYIAENFSMAKESAPPSAEPFQEALLTVIAAKNEPEIYKKANVSYKSFVKVMTDKAYKIKKPAAVAFSVALGLNLAETQSLIGKAGCSLDFCDDFDLIIRYFLEKEISDVTSINEALFAFDSAQLG